MQLKNPTLRRVERLTMLGCPVSIRDGNAYAPLSGLLLAALSAVIHAFRVRCLRAYWRRIRETDGFLGFGNEYMWENYIVMKYRCREVLPSAWFR